MNIVITTFSNPYSFFCLTVDSKCNKVCSITRNVESILESTCASRASKMDLSDVHHGQYVAVKWMNKWVRGVVSMKSQFLIWLIDYGIYMRPKENTVYTDLPTVYKKIPTKIFEASIHGIMPVDKIFSKEFQIENVISVGWNKGAIKKVQQLIGNATRTYFVPVGVLSAKSNDVVIGDLYFETKNKGTIINLIEELKMWPVFLESNKEAYIQNLSVLYTNRRRHRACLLKPVFPDRNFPNITLQTSLQEYEAICATITDFQATCEYDSMSEDGSTVLDAEGQYIKYKKPYKVTPALIEKYANTYIKVNGTEFNFLNVLVNKVRDLNICEQYKNGKSVGRATSRRSAVR